MLTLGKFSIGVGDRFAHQAKAQLQACVLAAKAGVEVIPVWNKSNREHTIIGSEPASVRAAADAAVRDLKWTKPYHVDADHIRFETVEKFLPACDFYTIDVADSIGHCLHERECRQNRYAEKHSGVARHDSPSRASPQPFTTTPADIQSHRREVSESGAGRRCDLPQDRVPSKGCRELHHGSLDRRDRFEPQTPPELLLILAACSRMKACRCRRSRRSSPAGSTRAWTTSATFNSSSASSATTSP